MKKCIDCKKEKKIDEFAFRSDKTHLRTSVCKKCMVIRATEWRKNNRERYNEYHRIRMRKIR